MTTALLQHADARIARPARTMLMTFAIASWSAVVLGVRDMNVLLVITFAWTSSAALRLAAMPLPQSDSAPVWGSDFALKAVIGALLWTGLPVLRLSHSEWWIWQPLALHSQLSATGVAVALCWPLRPFLLPRHVTRRYLGLPGGELETLLLSCSLFLVSGSPIFAGIAVACGLSRLARPALRGAWSGSLRPAA